MRVPWHTHRRSARHHDTPRGRIAFCFAVQVHGGGQADIFSLTLNSWDEFCNGLSRNTYKSQVYRGPPVPALRLFLYPPAYLPRSSFVTLSSYALQFRRVRPVCGLERSSRRAHQAAHLEKYRCRSRGVGTHCACGDARSPRRRRLRQRNACLGRHIASQTPRHHKDTRCEICIIAHRTKT